MTRKRLCTYTFGNGTVVHAAVVAINTVGEVREFTFDEMKAAADKVLEQNGETTNGRGPLRSFEIGGLICT